MAGGRLTGSISPASSFFHKHRLQFHRAYSVNLAVNIVILIYQAIYPHLRADLRDFRRAFDFQVFDDGNPIAFDQ